MAGCVDGYMVAKTVLFLVFPPPPPPPLILILSSSIPCPCLALETLSSRHKGPLAVALPCCCNWCHQLNQLRPSLLFPPFLWLWSMEFRSLARAKEEVENNIFGLFGKMLFSDHPYSDGAENWKLVGMGRYERVTEFFFRLRSAPHCITPLHIIYNVWKDLSLP